jgi:hypothetical protein
MAELNTITKGFDEKYYTNPEIQEVIDENVLTNLIKGNKGTFRFSIADAMKVYKARVSIANVEGENNYLGGRLG